MSETAPDRESLRATLAAHAVALLAVDPGGLGGAVLRGPASPAREAWLETLRGGLASLPRDDLQHPHGEEAEGRLEPGGSPVLGIEGPPRGSRRRSAALHHEANGGGSPWRRMPPQVAEGRLVGGLDLAATLAAGRPVAERGLFADAHGGALVVPMAERVDRSAAGLLAAALDAGEIRVERDGLALRVPARFAAILLDEGEGDERVAGVLDERVAFALDLDGLRPAGIGALEADVLATARDALTNVTASDEAIEALAAAGLAFGVPSLRTATFALRAAKAAAALAGRSHVANEDAEVAAALVIAPRATRLPTAEDDAPEDQADDPPPQEPPDADPDDAEAQVPGDEKPLAESVVEATRAAIPPGLLAVLSAAAAGLRRPSAAGRGGAPKPAARRGRPAGTRRGQPGHGVRLAIVETLRAAAPWQRLRREAAMVLQSGRVLIRRDDFRVGRFKQRSETVTIFVVDASGSAALHRLAEVKGAVELILAECYVRRDGVALIAFRGPGAELILPPTRSLARAKRALAGLPGGGGTPLAAAIEAASLLADRVTRAGQTPLVVLLTDGKANISRAGRPGRPEADADAKVSAQAFRAGGAAGLVLDIAPRPGDAAARLAHDMGARYIPLPYADAKAMSQIVLAATPAA